MKSSESFSHGPGVLAVAYSGELVEVVDGDRATTAEARVPRPGGETEVDTAVAGLGYARTSAWREGPGGLSFADVTRPCNHGLSWQIEPPDAEGWMRETCGSCDQILRYTLWPHHHRAVEALSERSDEDEECTCASCADDRRQAIEAAVRERQLAAEQRTGQQPGADTED